MTIKYLNELDELNYQDLGFILGNRPISVEEIWNLEQQYNNGKYFPDVLRELLYIAGKGCPLIDIDSFVLQEEIRTRVLQKGYTISRPFFGFDYRDRSSFSLVYTDENIHDPKVYHVELSPSEDEHTEFLEDSQFTLLGLLNLRIDQVKQGFNPY